MKARERLEQLYREIEQVILSRQHPVTGLLPASTSINTHGNYTDAWVRDNVYSILAPWALSLAYRKLGDRIRQDELEQATIKLMRGLLQSMMRQAEKVELFKHSLRPIDALHAKYDTCTGLSVVADDAWGHLQIDATSIFLLFVAQMTKSGLRIVCTYDEVDFVQNLIYYIASAYRTPDYGIWERGNKINNGKTEINASSVGMAKAALQALDGLNLFGASASPRAIVHTVADAISLARNSLASLLPRESLSKEVDSALLSVIGFPAFAVGDERRVTETRDEILNKLGGRYGCKRFLWDGHQTTIEDPHRLYYEHSELANFEHVESEWPLFFCYLYINALFRDNRATARYYREKIQQVMVTIDGMQLIPELYYLPAENIEAEKAEPHSQDRVPNANVPLVWAQSLYYTALLVDENFVDPHEIDAVNLRGNTTRLRVSQVALVVLAENETVKRQLAENGVIAESINDIAPIRVVSAPHLVEAYAQVGANNMLRLSGRPRRRLQSLATSQTYEINDQQCLCLSWIQSEDDDYRMRDAELVSIKLKKEIAHIRKHWLNSEAAVFTLLITQDLCNAPSASILYRTLQDLQLRTKHENVGYASASLAYRASRENILYTPGICLTPLQASYDTAAKYPKTPEVEKLIALMQRSEEEACDYMLALQDRDDFSEIRYQQLLSAAYFYAQEAAFWLCARLSFSLLNKTHSDLADYLSVLSARHFSVLVGTKHDREFALEPNSSNPAIVETIKSIAESPVELCLLQEVMATIGVLQRTQPQIFDGLRSIHLHNLLKLCSEDAQEWNDGSITELGKLSPATLMIRIEAILTTQHTKFTKALRKTLTPNSIEKPRSFHGNDAMDTDWFEWRLERGLIVNLDRQFLYDIWQSLAHARRLTLGDPRNQHYVIDCDLVRSSMTPGEEIFAKLIDDAIRLLHPAYYRSAIVEALLAYSRFCEKYPKVQFEQLDLGALLEMAASQLCDDGTQHNASGRDIDLLLQESPNVLQHYLEKAMLDVASITLNPSTAR